MDKFSPSSPLPRLRFTISVPVPLRTGGRGTRTRAEHARLLRVARAQRRLARREGRPVRQHAGWGILPAGKITASPSARTGFTADVTNWLTFV